DATLPVCSRRALVHVCEILGNRHYSLLAEWMTGIARRRQRVPFAVIPQVFDMVVQWRDLAPLAALVGDERGRWLALQHGPWRFIGEVDLNEAWAAANAPSSELSMDEALQA